MSKACTAGIKGACAEKVSGPIKELMDCHQAVLKQLDALEKTGTELENGANPESKEKELKEFLEFTDTSLALHTRDEEQALFPLLEPKICGHACGAHGAITPVEVMMANHKDVHAAFAVIRELMKLSKEGNLEPKEASTEIASQIRFIVDTMRDHIWKEDNVLYRIAKEELSKEDLGRISKKMTGFRETAGFVCSH